MSEPFRDDGHLSAEFIRQLEGRIRRIEDYREIENLMYRYIYACDELKDADLIASYFTEDCLWEARGNFSEFGTAEGREGVREMFVENPSIFPMTAHFLTNPIINLGRDGDTAWGQWHTLEAATLREHKGQVWMAAWYDNDFRRVDGDWRISHIRYSDTFVAPYEEGWLKNRYVSPLTLEKRSFL